MTRFSRRDVFWLTLVVGICCGWYLHDRRWSSKLENLSMDAQKERAVLQDELKKMKVRMGWWPTQPGEKLVVELDERGAHMISRTTK
jgi:hypothetical protein